MNAHATGWQRFWQWHVLYVEALAKIGQLNGEVIFTDGDLYIDGRR